MTSGTKGQTAVIVTGKDGLLSDRKEENVKIVHDAPVPEPGDGEVLVRVTLRPVNPSDVYRLTSFPGSSGRPSTVLPFVPGLEAVGVVEELGPGTSGLVKKGDRVVGVPWPSRTTGQGTWQQYVAVPEKNLVLVPDGVDDKDASQFLVNPVTAYGLVEDIAVPEGKWLLQTAAGSVLGRMVIALAKKRGVKTINVVRRSEQKQELLDLGADEVVATDKEDLVARVQEITGKEGAYGALDAVGGEGIEDVLRSVRGTGQVLVYGVLGGATMAVSTIDLIYQSKRLDGWVLFDWLAKFGPDAKKKLDEVWDLFLDGTIKPYTGKVYPLEKALEAVEASTKQARGGKILLEG